MTSRYLSTGQVNLVPNPSFEIYTTCPTGQNQLNRAFPWFNPTNDTPDYFNSCSLASSADSPSNNWGFQVARTGVSYSGIGIADRLNINRREYIEVELDDSLIAGKKYLCSFYASLAIGNTDGASNNIGCSLSQDSLIDYSTLSVVNVIPNYSYPDIIDDTLNWTKIEFTFNAIGGERFLTIGNFYPDSLTQIINFLNPSDTSNMSIAYYYVDDVYLGEYIPPVDTSDTASVFVEPAINPNPASEHLLLTYSLSEGKAGLFVLYNSIGQVVLTKPLEPFNGTKNLPLPTLSSGVYIANMILDNTGTLQKKIVVAK